MRGDSSFLSVLSLLAGLFLAAAGAQAAVTLHVDGDATGTPSDGSTWCNAFLSLDDALSAAASGDTILVAAGTYTPDPTGLGTPRDATFLLANGITLEGGYAGCGAPDPDARDIAAHATILTGDLNGDDGAGGAITDNAYHVVTCSGVGTTATLDGFTVTAGNAPPYGMPQALGGGLHINAADPTVLNCTFTGNYAGGGGGVGNTTGAPTFIECIFDGNVGGVGGGMYNLGGTPLLLNCTFRQNQGEHPAGGMAEMSGASILVNCIFSGNVAGERGGAFYVYTAPAAPTLINCTLIGNSAGLNGGGMYSLSAGAALTNCILWGNGPEEIFGTLPVVTYSCIQGWPWGGAGNIWDDPLLVDPGAGDYHLSPGSPCLGAGDNSALPTGVTTDFDGNPRISGGIIDMGAYELQLPAPQFIRGDCNGTGLINIADVICMIDVLFTPLGTSCEMAVDGNGNDVMNVADPVYLLYYLFAAGPIPPMPCPDCGQNPSPAGPLTCISHAACP